MFRLVPLLLLVACSSGVQSRSYKPCIQPLVYEDAARAALGLAWDDVFVNDPGWFIETTGRAECVELPAGTFSTISADGHPLLNQAMNQHEHMRQVQHELIHIVLKAETGRWGFDPQQGCPRAAHVAPWTELHDFVEGQAHEKLKEWGL